MKNRDLQPRLLYTSKLSFRIKGQIKSFPERKKKTKGVISPNHYYIKCLRDLFKKKKRIKTMNNNMVINTNLSIESKKQTKQIRTEMES